MKFFLELQISQQNLSVSLRLPAQGAFFKGSLIYKVGGVPHITPINPELCRQLRLSLSNCLSHKNYFSDSRIAKISYILIQKDKFHIMKL